MTWEAPYTSEKVHFKYLWGEKFPDQDFSSQIVPNQQTATHYLHAFATARMDGNLICEDTRTPAIEFFPRNLFFLKTSCFTLGNMEQKTYTQYFATIYASKIQVHD